MRQVFREGWIGLGSNLGDRKEWLGKALFLLHRPPEVQVVLCSRLMATAPWGVVDQPWFLNGVAKIYTSLQAQEMLALLKGIEGQLGRRSLFRYGPRCIDLDLLFLGDEVVETEELTLPHPKLTERYFVLRPLYELAPELVHPKLGKRIDQLWREFLLSHPDCREGWEISTETWKKTFSERAFSRK